MIYPATEEYIDLAVNTLKSGKIIIYPTDTLYGFGVDATNTDAIKSLNHLKGRSQPLSIIIDSTKKIEKFAILNNKIVRELENIFPGQYTVLLPAKKSTISPLVCKGSPLIGIRVPLHFFALEITKKLGKPIITTSINKHGNEPINNVTQAEIDFPKINIFEDNKHHPSIGSTIINMTKNPFSIVRKGDGKYPK